MSTVPSVLLVEDSETDSRIVQHAINYCDNFDVDFHVEQDFFGAKEWLQGARADLVLLDLGLPDASGMEALKGLLKICPDAPIVILTGLDDMELGLLAIQLGAEDYLPKSQLNAENLERIIRHSIARFQSRSARK